MHPLDELFGQMAEACRAYLHRYSEARPTPSRTSDSNANRLVDALHELERLVDELDAFFAAPADEPGALVAD